MPKTIITIEAEESTRILRTIAESVNKGDIEGIFLINEATEMLLGDIQAITGKNEDQILTEIYGDRTQEVKDYLEIIKRTIGKCLCYKEQIARFKEKKEQLDPNNPFFKKYNVEYQKVICFSKYLQNLLSNLIERTNLRNQMLKENWFISQTNNLQRTRAFSFGDFANRLEPPDEENRNEDF